MHKLDWIEAIAPAGIDGFYISNDCSLDFSLGLIS